MKMNIKTILAAAMAFVLAASCAKQEKDSPTDDAELIPVQMTLNVVEPQGNSRSVEPIRDEGENWIYDYYYIQFDADGFVRTQGHRRANVSVGDVTVTDVVPLSAGQGTVCIIANITPAGANYGDDPGWKSGSHVMIADNFETFKNMKFDMTERLTAAQNGTLLHTPMCGYWQGSVSASQNMAVTLGRMIVRLNIHITNNSSRTFTRVFLGQASKKAYIFPQVHNANLVAADYMSFDDTGLNIAPNTTKTLYYYTAPNYNEWFKNKQETGTGSSAKGLRTYLNFYYGSTILHGTNYVLSTYKDVDDNLYMNTIYNFNFKLQ